MCMHGKVFMASQGAKLQTDMCLSPTEGAKADTCPYRLCQQSLANLVLDAGRLPYIWYQR